MAAPAMPHQGVVVPGVDPADATQILPPGADRRVWRAMRRTGLGGSDISALLGMSGYRAPIHLWEDKTGAIPLLDVPPSEAAEMGELLEPVVRDRFARVHGFEVRLAGMLRSSRWPWAFANPDGWVDDGSGVLTGYEGKTCDKDLGPEWGTDRAPLVPDHAELQAQWGMAVTGAHGWWVAALIGGNRNVYRYLHRDEHLIADLVSITGHWWRAHVLDGVEPEPDGSRAWTTYLRRKFAVAEPGSVVQLSAEDGAAIQRERREALLAERHSKQGHESVKNRVRRLLGNAERLVGLGGQQIATYKHTSRFRHKAFAEAEPDLYQQYLTTVEATDVERLKRDHPDIYRAYCVRELRFTD
ncbi:lambda-exonuclease family protein [Saccharothrix xinjiangensis]|uniref:YqaJ viral recombinase family protein n=1 Tax=Saccharothrix xinjiangensis TaxID=204798 RepID=A0ABV9XTL7_9PSEU